MRIQHPSGIIISFLETEYSSILIAEEEISITSFSGDKKIISISNVWTSKNNKFNSKKKHMNNRQQQLHRISLESGTNLTTQDSKNDHSEKKSFCSSSISPPKQHQYNKRAPGTAL